MGRLELIIGPMFASKSTELIRNINRYSSIGMNILVINHKLNTRYNTNGISTHDKHKFENCVILENLHDIFSDDLIDIYNNANVIIIEELQFFKDAYNVITNIVDNTDKIIIAAGLVGDVNRKPFGDVLLLIPHAEKIIHLSALCKKCGDGTLAPFTIRKIDSEDQIQVGIDDLYESVCRKHISTAQHSTF